MSLEIKRAGKRHRNGTDTTGRHASQIKRRRRRWWLEMSQDVRHEQSVRRHRDTAQTTLDRPHTNTHLSIT